MLAFSAIESVCDPEIPVLTIMDLGVFRSLSIDDKNGLIVTITPTYSGCPAMSMIAFDVEVALGKAGFKQVTVHLSLKPAWTTDWMTKQGKKKLVDYGIAAPIGKSSALKTDRAALFGITEVCCPRCKSNNTEKLAEFGSTACKAQYRCKSCLEPFDYFKCI
ncbi:MAG: phenylacetate-CoA oxygenase subunit PaaJ [Rhizobiales bacterium]|nr:phenylacetate-CoA oxygenase subunit PaaJ [Hyphomicrobiales bacterium]